MYIYLLNAFSNTVHLGKKFKKQTGCIRENYCKRNRKRRVGIGYKQGMFHTREYDMGIPNPSYINNITNCFLLVNDACFSCPHTIGDSVSL